VPAQALALAFAASIYPPALAAVIALGRGSQVRSRVFAFVFAAVFVTYALGVVMLLVLVELGATGPHHIEPSAAIDMTLGVLLIALAARLRRKRPPRVSKQGGPSKMERYLRSRRLALVLGLTLYALPSPIYIGAVKEIADAKLSTGGELLALLATVTVMLWLIELPMLMLFAVPERASALLERVNLWFARYGRRIATFAALAAGVYLIVEGVVKLVS
jgi:hypothetical protein